MPSKVVVLGGRRRPRLGRSSPSGRRSGSAVGVAAGRAGARPAPPGLPVIPGRAWSRPPSAKRSFDLGRGPDRRTSRRACPSRRCPRCRSATSSALLLPAVAVAALAALESLLSATVADAMSVGGRHDSDRELVGQGLANLGRPALRRDPRHRGHRADRGQRPVRRDLAAGRTDPRRSCSRSSCWSPRGGSARSRCAALAGVLVATAIQMVRVSSVAALLRSTRGDAAVLAVTAVATVALDLVTAVLIGLVVAGFFALQQTARSASSTRCHSTPTTTATRSARWSTSTSSPTASTVRCSSRPPTTSCSSSPTSRGCGSSSCVCRGSPRSTPPGRTCSPTPSTASSGATSPCCSPG